MEIFINMYTYMSYYTHIYFFAMSAGEITTLDPLPVPHSQVTISLQYTGALEVSSLEKLNQSIPKFKNSSNSRGKLPG